MVAKHNLYESTKLLLYSEKKIFQNISYDEGN